MTLLKTMDLNQATEYQFKLIDTMTKHFTGKEFLNLGSVGVSKSVHTSLVEQCLADFFQAEDCILVRGSGTGAIRWSLYALIPSGGTLLIHKAPVYPTTETTIKTMHLNTVSCDFNDLESLKSCFQSQSIDAVHIQLARQNPDDFYDIEKLIQTIRSYSPNIPISVDDNYGVMKVPKISCALGANLSSFSLFKLLGPEGIGCVVGSAEAIQKIKTAQYSGGSQVQGHEAMECIRSLVYTPVMLALQSAVIDELVPLLNSSQFPFIKNAFAANAQSKVLLTEFHENIAQEMLRIAETLGALPHPVGAESRYDVLPLFYKVSGTFLKENPSMIDNTIRINPNRAGKETIIRILQDSYQQISSKRRQ